MKKILAILAILLMFFVSQVCFAGRLQEMHKAVIAAKNGAGGGTSKTVTWGLYELADFVPDSRSGNTSITDATLNGGGPTTSWIGFYVTASGTGSGSALITGWNDGSDTITTEAGLTLADDATITIGCRHTTVQDTYLTTISAAYHSGTATEGYIEYDTTNSSYQYYIGYIPAQTDISDATSITSAYFYAFYTVSELNCAGGCDTVVGQIIDGSASPNTTLWTESASGANKDATYNYKDQDTSLDWEADSSNNFADILPSATVSATVQKDGTDNTWATYTITDLVDNWVIDDATNLGFYLANIEDNLNAARIGSKENATETSRWIIKVTYVY